MEIDEVKKDIRYHSSEWTKYLHNSPQVLSSPMTKDEEPQLSTTNQFLQNVQSFK